MIGAKSRPAEKSGVRPFFKILPVAVVFFILVLFAHDYTKKPPANIVKRPRAKAKSKASAPAQPPVQTPKVQTPEPALSGEWLVCGFERQEKRRADRADMGEYKLKGLGPTWARFESGESVLLTGIQRPSTNITGYVGETLWVEGKKVDTSGMSFEQLQEATKNQTGKSRVDVLKGVDGRYYFRSGSSSGLMPLPGQAPCTEVLTALENLDLEAFERSVNSENVNALFSGYGNTGGLLALTAGYSPRVKKNIGRGRRVSYAPYVKILLERGADVQKFGEEAFWKTSDVDTAALLLDAGVPINCRNDKGRTKLFHASKDMEALLLARGIDPKLRDNDGKTRDEFKKRRRK